MIWSDISDVRFTNLLSPQSLISTARLINDREAIPGRPGVYGWWIKPTLLRVPFAETRMFDGYHLLYVGIAPRAPTEDGRQSRSTLRRRITRDHLGKRLSRSTLRRSLAKLLQHELKLEIVRGADGRPSMSSEDERRLTEWLHANAALSFIEDPEPWVLERTLLAGDVRLPLNIRGSSHSFARELSKLRTAD